MCGYEDARTLRITRLWWPSNLFSTSPPLAPFTLLGKSYINRQKNISDILITGWVAGESGKEADADAIALCHPPQSSAASVAAPEARKGGKEHNGLLQLQLHAVAGQPSILPSPYTPQQYEELQVLVYDPPAVSASLQTQHNPHWQQLSTASRLVSHGLGVALAWLVLVHQAQLVTAVTKGAQALTELLREQLRWYMTAQPAGAMAKSRRLAPESA
jgi:hypothetical protein